MTDDKYLFHPGFLIVANHWEDDKKTGPKPKGLAPCQLWIWSLMLVYDQRLPVNLPPYNQGVT